MKRSKIVLLSDRLDKKVYWLLIFIFYFYYSIFLGYNQRKRRYNGNFRVTEGR